MRSHLQWSPRPLRIAEPPNFVKLDQHVGVAPDDSAQWCRHAGDIPAERAIELVTQRCLPGIGICANWTVTQSAEIDATAAGFDGTKSSETTKAGQPGDAMASPGCRIHQCRWRLIGLATSQS